MWPGFPVPKTATLPPLQAPIGGITISPPSVPPIITITSTPIPENIKLVLDEWGMGIKEPEKCTCDIMVLMAVGCKCGQFQREQKK